VDDRIPVSTTDGRPLFTSCRDESEFWVCIIEKAYAKLYGSYQAIAGAKVNDILVDFTGECSDTLYVHFSRGLKSVMVLTGFRVGLVLWF
jgi:hypothetical protein